jgi:hypothetical protein
MDKFNKAYIQLIKESVESFVVYELKTLVREDDEDFDSSYGFFTSAEKANLEKERIMNEMLEDDGPALTDDDFEIIEHEVK